MKKKLLFIIFILMILLLGPNVNAATVKVDTNKIYFLNDEDIEFISSIPSNYKTKAQITVTGATEVSYSSADEEWSPLRVSKTGEVTIQPYYCSPGSFKTCTTSPDAVGNKTYKAHSADIIVTADNTDYKVTISTMDYVDVYIDNFFDTIIKKYPSNTSTEKGKIQPILDWISKETEYSADYSYTKDMVFHSAGDCWASSRVIVDFARKLGIKAVVRTNAKYTDTGVGSGHENVYAELDGIGYVIEAGYNMAIPRTVTFARTDDNGWYWGSLNYITGHYYTSYNGFAKNVSVPENNVLTGLGYWAIHYGLNEYSTIESLHIPKTITEIQDSALANVPTLKTITVDSNNPNYASFDGSLFSKDLKTLITYPSGKKAEVLNVYDFIETIGYNAIAYNPSIKKIIVPNGVKTIKTGAITQNENLRSVEFSDTVETIEDNPIRRTGVYPSEEDLKYIVIRNKNASIGKLGCSDYLTIFGHKASTAEEYANNSTCNFIPLEDINGDTSKIKLLTKENVSYEPAVYTGEPVLPKLTITVDGKKLTAEKDYIIKDVNKNINAGIGYLDILGKGAYVGKVRVNFEIEKKPVSWTLTNPVVDYTGKPQSPVVVINDSYHKGKIQYADHPYASDRTDKKEYTLPGEYRLGLIIDGDYNFKSVNEYITFKIKGLDITKATIENVENFTYSETRDYLTTINNKKVTYNGKTLVKDTDYTQTLKSVRTDENNNRVYKILIKGKGLYEGELYSNEFVIATNYELVTNYKDGKFLKPNEKFSLQISSSIGLPLDQSNFTYSSSKDNIAEVNESGVITAKEEGQTTIYVYSKGTYGKSTYFTIIVSKEAVPMELMTLNIYSYYKPTKVGGTSPISPSFYPTNTTDSKKLIYKSSDESILTVNEKGTVTGIKEGVAYVTATTSKGLTDTIRVVVGTDPEEVPLQYISLLKYPTTLEVGQTSTLGIGITPENTTVNKNFVYHSTNNQIAIVDSNGIITAKKEGRVYITINCDKQYTQTFELTVTGKKSIELDKTSLTLDANETLKNNTYQLKPTLNNISGTVSYSTSNSSVATVSSDGIITAKKAGTATITARASGYSATCTVTVVINPTSITPNKTTITLEEGKSEQVTLTYTPTNTTEKKITWSSSNSNIASVDNNGKIVAVKTGTATITATTKNGKKATIAVTIKEKEILPTKVELNPTSGTLAIGENTKLTPIISPENVTNKVVTWESSDKAIATVDSNGKVIAKKVGTTTITVKTSNNKTATYKLTVIAKPVEVTGIELTETNKEVEVGEQFTLVANIQPTNATNKTITWESSNKAIATVSNGKVTALKDGTVTITATTSNGKKSSCNVVIKKAPQKVSYTTHVQSYGWQSYVSNGKMAGTEGEAKRLEGIKIKLENQEYSGNVLYRTHIQKIGWEKDFKKNDQMSGTEGQALRLEAIEIKLEGEIASHYDIYYRVHAQKFGWLGWARNGESAGTASYAYRLEGIEIKLVDKNSKFSDYGVLESFKEKKVVYTTHVQTYGWQDYAFDGNMAGTSGEAKRLEGIKIMLNNPKYEGDILYRTHIQTYGWEEQFKKNNEMSGTSGEAKRLEAIEIKLTGEMEKHYDVYYRVHAQTYGWLAWAKNGERAGTAGFAKRLEGIEILLVNKGELPPARDNQNNENSYIENQ